MRAKKSIPGGESSQKRKKINYQVYCNVAWCKLSKYIDTILLTVTVTYTCISRDEFIPRTEHLFLFINQLTYCNLKAGKLIKLFCSSFFFYIWLGLLCLELFYFHSCIYKDFFHSVKYKVRLNIRFSYSVMRIMWLTVPFFSIKNFIYTLVDLGVRKVLFLSSIDMHYYMYSTGQHLQYY